MCGMCPRAQVKARWKSVCAGAYPYLFVYIVSAKAFQSIRFLSPSITAAGIRYLSLVK